MQAEALALLLGILICNALHIQDVQIECDSSTLISWFAGKQRSLRDCMVYLRELINADTSLRALITVIARLTGWRMRLPTLDNNHRIFSSLNQVRTF